MRRLRLLILLLVNGVRPRLAWRLSRFSKMFDVQTGKLEPIIPPPPTDGRKGRRQ